MTTHELTAKAQTRLVHTLQTRKNVLSIPHKKALYSLVESFMKMGSGTLTGRWAFPIPTGCGKTTAVVECCATLHHAGNTALSAVVCASRIEALCTMKRDMLAAGIPANKIGLIYSGAKAAKYSEPCTTDNDSRQFLLISHNRVANETHLQQFNTYHGEPRSIVIYDESLLVSEIEHFLVDQLTGALGKWIAKLKLDLTTQPDLANISNWMTERLNVIHAAYTDFDKASDNLLSAPCFTLSIEEQVEWQARFKTEGDTILSEFLSVQHLPLRLVRHNKTAAVSYQITIPQSLTNMLVLDASYPIRTLENDDKTLQDAENLPCCKAFQIKFDALKRFDLVTLYRMSQHGGRSSVATHKAKMKKILLDTVKIIQDIPKTDEVLVFVYKDRQKVSSAKMLETELDRAGVKCGQRIHIQTWGNETSTNVYHSCKHVILVGILHRDLTELEAHHLGQLNDISKIVTPKTLKDLCLSERVHLAYQALSRGCCRVMGSEGQAEPMTGYLIEADDDIETELSSVMPGVVWKTWKPVYSDTVAHGQLLTTLQKRISTTLTTMSEDQVTCRSFKADVLKEERIDKNTWKRALKGALSQNPQWIQVDQRLQRAA